MSLAGQHSLSAGVAEYIDPERDGGWSRGLQRQQNRRIPSSKWPTGHERRLRLKTTATSASSVRIRTRHLMVVTQQPDDIAFALREPIPRDLRAGTVVRAWAEKMRDMAMQMGDRSNHVRDGMNDAGCVPPIVVSCELKFLTISPDCHRHHHMAHSKPIVRDSIQRAGGLSILIAMAHRRGAKDASFSAFAIRALGNMLSEAASRKAIQDAGGIPALVGALVPGLVARRPTLPLIALCNMVASQQGMPTSQQGSEMAAMPDLLLSAPTLSRTDCAMHTPRIALAGALGVELPDRRDRGLYRTQSV